MARLPPEGMPHDRAGVMARLPPEGMPHDRAGAMARLPPEGTPHDSAGAMARLPLRASGDSMEKPPHRENKAQVYSQIGMERLIL